MCLLKKLAVVALSGVFLASLAAQQVDNAQSADDGSGSVSVESSYSQESVQMQMIQEQAATNDRENQMAALDYIKNAIDSGSKDAQLCEVLSNLALDGTLNRATFQGSVINNFPDVRQRAVMYLGELGTQQAGDALLRVMQVENEPTVLRETVNALTKDKVDPTQAIPNIIRTFVPFNVTKPDNRLALAVVNAINTIVLNFNVKSAKEQALRADAIATVRDIAHNYSYGYSVRSRANAVLAAFYKGSDTQDPNATAKTNGQ
jgi:hypothetical protein